MANLVEIAGQLVAAHAANSNITTEELIAEIAKVHAALVTLEAGVSVESGTESKPTLTIKEAFKKHEVACMVCGKGGFKTLTRHLNTAHDLKPGDYKKQFGIPSKQSLSAKAYSESRRAMALDRGLADNLAKARYVRMANIEERKAVAAKAEKAAKAAKSAAPAKVAKVKAVKALALAPAPALAKATKAPVKAKAMAPAKAKATAKAAE
jgi:predicted transcriptional regulator